MFKRLTISDKKIKDSFFILGPRKTGKSTYLRDKFKGSIFYDLLDKATFERLSREPSLFTQELQSLKKDKKIKGPVVIDEIQLLPELLHSVHWLIENEKLNFILCGSSARKLRQSGVNMLGGRALGKKFFPLTFGEIEGGGQEFDLLKAMKHGLIPDMYLSKENIERKHAAYINEYLDFEIKREGLTRRLDTFHKFLDCVGISNTELINFSNIARDCGVSSVTVKGYYEILNDTLLGTYVFPYSSSNKRDNISATPKFYFFDIGIANFLSNTEIHGLDDPRAGKSFEHLIYLELLAYINYRDKFMRINFFRTKRGQEVDFLITKARDVKVAIECKLAKKTRERDIKGIKAFAREQKAEKYIVVSREESSLLIKTNDGIEVSIYPWRRFLTDLWNGEIF